MKKGGCVGREGGYVKGEEGYLEGSVLWMMGRGGNLDEVVIGREGGVWGGKDV